MQTSAAPYIRTVASAVLSAVVAALAFSLPAAHGQAQMLPAECGSLENHYGPLDYTNPAYRKYELPLVENAHFTRDVYELRRGATETFPLHDIDYTLRAFPNHHPALDAIARLHREHSTEKFPQGRYTITCWFLRARAFRPADGMVPLIQGGHLFQLRKFAEAEEPLRRAVELMPQSAEAAYNLGLVYVRLNRYGDARTYAHKAYGMGFTLPGLRNQLEQRGEWRASE
jgi:Flp pilus assembly protein TadD